MSTKYKAVPWNRFTLKCKNMERYSRVSSSKWQSKYSEEFKRFVCNDYLTGSLTSREVEVKHG